MKITDILGFKYNGIEAIEAKFNGIVVWKNAPAEIEFASCPFPTSWTAVTSKTAYTATNDYGVWNLIATNSYNTTNIPSKAFDNDASTYWRATDFSNDTETREIEIDCPVYIKPTNIYLSGGRFGTDSKIQGFNVITQVWEDIYIIEKTTSFDDTVAITTENYYSKFKVVAKRYGSSSTQKTLTISEFQIKSGFMKGA